MQTPRARKILAYLDALAPAYSEGALGKFKTMAERCVAADSDLPWPKWAQAMATIGAVAPPDFALRFGGSRRIIDFGLIGHALMSCRTVRDASNLVRGFAEQTGEPFAFALDIRDGVCSSYFDALAAVSPTISAFCAEEWAASFQARHLELSGFDCASTLLNFRHARRPGVDYERYLRGRIRFGCPRNSISYPVEVLDLTILTHDENLHQLLLLRLMAGRSASKLGSLSASLWALFARAPQQTPSLEEAARAMGLSARTLHRRLAAEQVNYGELLARFRLEYVSMLACEGYIGAKQLAHAVGYQNHHSLRRAVRKWTGKPLSQLRRSKDQTLSP